MSKIENLASLFGDFFKGKRIIVAVIAVAFLVLGVYGATRAYNYTQNDTQFCRSCHIMEKAWDRWQSSEHQSITCHSCHEQSPLESTQLLVTFALQQPERVSKHAYVPDEACDRCHENGNPKYKQVAAEAGHRVHAEEQNIACVKCHGVTIHRFQPPKQICGVCHEGNPVKVTPMASIHCLECHNYVGEGSLLPTRKDCLECHQTMPQSKVNWPSQAPMQFQCKDCHKPHVQEAPVVQCLSCHPGVPSAGKHTVKAHASVSCQTCHKPHEWTVTKRETCLSCHSAKENHNPGPSCTNCHSYKLAKPGGA